MAAYVCKRKQRGNVGDQVTILGSTKHPKAVLNEFIGDKATIVDVDTQLKGYWLESPNKDGELEKYFGNYEDVSHDILQVANADTGNLFYRCGVLNEENRKDHSNWGGAREYEEGKDPNQKWIDRKLVMFPIAKMLRKGGMSFQKIADTLNEKCLGFPNVSRTNIHQWFIQEKNKRC